MNNLSVEEGNKLIAEFMGIGHTKLSAKGHYHDSWSWLMPVVEKIEKTDASEFNYNAVAMADFRWKRKEIIDIPISSSIEWVWNKVVEFIKWYNNQKIKV